MTRLAVLASLALSGCIEVQRTGYVLRSVSANASPGSIGMTWTFDNHSLPASASGCLQVCTVE